MGSLLFLWYCGFAAVGVFAAFTFSDLRPSDLHEALPIVLFAAFLFWQWIPLLTMTGGWSLQLNKLQAYPISNDTFFWIETMLRLSTAPELILVVFGIVAGLTMNPAVSVAGALLLLLYLPFNLFVTLAIRETLLVSFHRSRFRELFAVLFVAAAVLPQVILRTSLGDTLKPYFKAALDARSAPWRAFADLALTGPRPLTLLIVICWTALVGWLARVQFARSLRTEETPRAQGAERRARRSLVTEVTVAIASLFRDPIAALIEKEIRSLVRMPRFRVIFGMACIFSIVIFFPIGFGKGGGTAWVRENFLPVVNLYGLLLLGDTLLWNVFGFDRAAAQFWFLTESGLRTAFRAKNLTAVLFIALQNVVVLAAALLMRFEVSAFNIESALMASAVVTLYFLSIGNLSSVGAPRAVDPSQTLRKQAGGRLQLWLLGSSVAMFILVGFAFLARWALASDWALVGVFSIEFAVGLVVYRIAIDSAVQRGMRNREAILDSLSKGTAPVSM